MITPEKKSPEPQPLEERRALLARLLRQRTAETTFVPSYPQQRLWFLDQLQPENPVYNVPLGYRLQGPLDVSALQHGLNEIVRRHEILRTVFRETDAGPRQVVIPPSLVALPVIDLSDSPRQEEERWIQQQAGSSFDLSRGPLLRPLLIRRGPAQHTLLLTVHHVVFDGWSARVLVTELTALYAAFTSGNPSPLPALPIQYAEFAEWQHRHLAGETLDRLLHYWRTQLDGVTAIPGLVTDTPRPQVQSYHGDFHTFEVSATVLTPLVAFGQAGGATPFMTLLAAFAALLDRYTEGDQLVLGTPIANRGRAELEPLIGFFTNTLVLRLITAGNPTFAELLERVKQTTVAAYAHQDLPFERLVDELHPERDLAQNPLFQVLFSYREGENEILHFDGVQGEMVVGRNNTAKFDLSLSLTRLDDCLHGRLEFSTDLFRADTVRRLAAQFQTLVENLVEARQRRLDELPIFPEAERRQLLESWNKTAADYPRDQLVHQLIEARVEPNSRKIALVFGHRELTYDGLNRRANQLAHLLRGHGVGPEVAVGVFLDRGPEMVVAMLGILKAGGAYLPLDPAYPEDRLAFVLHDAAAPVIVTNNHLARRLEPGSPAPYSGTLVCLDGDRESLAAQPSENPSSTATPASSAYLIYTSGSTGLPKGVCVTHRTVVNFFTGMDGIAGAETGAGVAWLAVTSISFDISVLELLWTLARGFEVVIHDERAASNMAKLSPAAQRPISFSLFYFGGDPRVSTEGRYRLLLEGARFADQHGFEAVWTPERHFHDFGGLFPNPAVTGAALAAITQNVQIRAGSVVLPLHEPLRVAEEWSVVDNLSGGRAGISFASGWHADDFSLAPTNYTERKQIMLDGIAEVRRLWRGETTKRLSGTGQEVELGIYPPPVQDELPVWLTSAGNPETFRIAGEMGAHVLTHLLGHDIDQLADKLEVYRQAWRLHQPTGEGYVTVMLHTFVSQDAEEARDLARGPLSAYLKTSFSLLANLGRSMGREVDFKTLPAAELDELVEQAVERFGQTAALLGTPEACADMIDRLKTIGIDEVGCLIDFGIDVDVTLAHLSDLNEVRQICEQRRQQALRGAEHTVAAQIRRRQISHLQCTPSMARLLLAEDGARESIGELSKLLLGGEALPSELARELLACGVGELHNMYGPTETTVWSTTQRVTPHTPVTIGRPIANTHIYLLDRHLRPTPTGVPGELCIGGDGVTRGYHRRPRQTGERFIPDAFGNRHGSRLYRTGDLARYQPSGELEFLGRLDHQVKIRGYRIELGEIETLLASFPGVNQAVVIARDGQHGDRQLVAYYLTTDGANSAVLSPRELRAHLQRQLPDYMLPAAYVRLEAWPLTPNGKVDRGALPDPEHATRPTTRAELKPPSNKLESTIAGIWQETLQLDRVGVNDNFFDLGGNSFSVVHVRSRLLQALKRAPTLVELFRYPTVGSLAEALARSEAPSFDQTPSLNGAPVRNGAPARNGAPSSDEANETSVESVENTAQKRRRALSRRGHHARQLKERQAS